MGLWRIWETNGTADGFAVGEFSLYVGPVPVRGAWAVIAALMLSGWAGWRRARRAG